MEDNTSLTERLNHINNWINNCDQKAAIILTFFSVMVPLIFTTDLFTSRIMSLTTPIKDYWLNNEGCFSFFNFIICSILVILGNYIVKCIYFLLKVLNGRIDENEFNQEGLEIDSLFFFGTISKKSFNTFKDQINDAAYNSDNDLLSQIYINSVIAQGKFKYYNKALKSLGAFLITFGIVFIIFLFI